MCGSADRRPTRAPLGAALLALGLLGLLAAGAASAPGQGEAGPASTWDILADEAEAKLADPAAPTAELERLRDRLAGARRDALEAERANAPTIAELSDRLEALGPAPAEDAEEAPEIAARRQALSEELATAQAPALEAQDVYQRANSLIDRIDGVVRARFTAELRSQGPIPLLPRNWAIAAADIERAVAAYAARLSAAAADPATRATALRRLPINVVLAGAGIVLTLVLRGWLVDLVERRLASATSRRSIAWLVALRNIGRLIVPAVGAGLILAALSPQNLVGRAGPPAFFHLPDFVLVLIWAGWLGQSLFAPRLPAYRLLPVDDADARRGAWLTVFAGAVLALRVLLDRVTPQIEVHPATLAVLYFPVIVLAAGALAHCAGVIATIAARLSGRPGEQAAGALLLPSLRLAVALLRAVAVLAPLLAAFGYFAASRFLLFPSLVTLGLFGTGLVLFALLAAAASLLAARPGAHGRDGDGGLVPVFVAMLLVVVALPVLALVWGARPSDLADLWTLLVDGVTFGGITISAAVVLKLAAVLAIGIGLTRLLQSLLRTSVLPRTRLDAGGRNAVLAGVGYVGFFFAGLVSISAAGIDLSNIAIVAGALSVGIGFGLQNVVSNFVSGIILLVERPIKEGDWIEVGAFAGYVRGISVRSTEIETFDKASVILPNSDLIAGTVLNRTHKGMSGRLQVPVSVDYDSDPRQVEEILLSIAETHPLVLEDPSPRVLFMNLSPDSMDFEIRCWLRDVNYSLSARSDMNYEIVERLGAAGIHLQPHLREARVPPAEPPEAEAAPPPPVARKAGRRA